MFNCYDTILQQQQRRSQESNKVLTRRCICEEYLNVTSLKKEAAVYGVRTPSSVTLGFSKDL